MSSQPAAPRQGRGTFIAHGIWLVAWLLTHHHALVTAAPAVLSAGSAPEHVSVTGAGHSFLPSFSADGRSLAFVSFANNLVTNDAPKPFTDVFVRQLGTSNTLLVSVNSTSRGGGNGHSTLPMLSSNGLVAAFESLAGDLVSEDTNGVSDVFVRNLATETTTLVSVNASGQGSGKGPSRNPLISADGRYVIFESSAPDLVTNDFNGTNDIFIRDLATGITTLATPNAAGTQSANGPSFDPTISADGLVVAFMSQATDLVAGATNRAGEIYVRQILQAQSTWATAAHLPWTHNPSNGVYRAAEPVLSGDGRFVAFKTGPGAVVRFDLQRSTNTVLDVFPPSDPLSDIPTNYFYFADNPRVDPHPSLLSNSPLSISFDGRFVALAAGTNGLSSAIYRTDFETFTRSADTCCAGTPGSSITTNQWPVVELASQAITPNAPAGGVASIPLISSDGRRVCFLSTSTIPPGLTAASPTELYLRDMGSDEITLVSTNRIGAPAAGLHNTFPAMSPEGDRVAFETTDSQVVAGDLNAAGDVFVRDSTTGDTQLVSASLPSLPAATGNRLVFLSRSSLSVDGNYLAYSTPWDEAVNAAGDPGGVRPPVSPERLVRRDLVTGRSTLLGGRMITYATYSTNAWMTNTVETWAHDASISANGRYVSFSLNPQNVVGWWDTWSGEVIQANRPEITQSAFHPAISADGLRVAFDDNTRLFFADFSSGWPSNRYVGMSQRVRSSPGSGTWLSPIFSPDDRWILFGSTATDLVTNTLVTSPFTFSQLFAQRVETRQTRLVSSRPSQDQSGFAGDATDGVFSADSRFVVFEASDPYGTPPMILRHDLLAGGINLLVCSNCSNPSISGDGRFVVFQQPAPQPGRQDIVLIDLLTGISNLVSVNVAGTGGGNGLSVTPRISHDARYVVFTSTSDDLITADTNRASDIFVRDLLTGTTRCLSMRYDGTGTGNQLSSSPVLAANGRTVVFSSFAGDLVPGDANGTRDVFVASLGGPDTDLDGMDDDWEMAYFNTQARDGHGDFDHDGVADLDEFRAGTNPADDTSTLRVLTLQSALTLPVDGTRRTVLTWSATPGRTYRVQAKEDVAGAWIDLEGDVLATSTTATKVEILPAGVERRFHRVVLLR